MTAPELELCWYTLPVSDGQIVGALHRGERDLVGRDLDAAGVDGGDRAVGADFDAR